VEAATSQRHLLFAPQSESDVRAEHATEHWLSAQAQV
jgi:hypothetical protein